MAACTSQNTEQTVENQSEEPAAANVPVKPKTEKPSESIEGEDGTVISFQQIEVKGLNPDVNAFQMMYWSEGVETAAYVTVPKKTGYYYLNLMCHGGYVYPLDLSSIHALPSGLVLNAETMISDAHSELVTLSPLYRGYGDSKGTVGGLNGAVLDTNHAIDAIQSYFKEGNMESTIKSGYISTNGITLGGGVVLKLSEMRNDIGNVVAINPYVGLDLLYPWAESHPENDWNEGFLETYHEEFGEFDPDSQFVKDESIQLSRSFIPTLIVQGQKDEVVNWELTQTFFEKLKETNQNEHTNYVLIPEGDHELTEHQAELIQITDDWYKEISGR
ncbi:alpha/beta hydrolase family protein [Bacillus sp. AK031]